MVEFGWLPLTEAPQDAHYKWGRDFYDIFHTISWDDPHPIIHVRVVNVPLNATTINEVLEVPEFPNLQYEAKLREMDLE